MGALRTRVICFAFLLTLTGFAGTGFPYTKSMAFSPEEGYENYSFCDSWDTEGGIEADARAGANLQSGAVGVCASAWIGASASQAWQGVEFYLWGESSIEATVEIEYAGGTGNVGPAAWCGTEWMWRVDGGRWHRSDIDPPCDPWDLTLKVLEIVSVGLDPALLGLKAGTLAATAIESLSTFIDGVSLATAIDQAITAKKGERFIRHFDFTVNKAGRHKLEVGLRANASGCLFGSGFAIMAGRIASIDLKIHSDFIGPPDLVIQDIDYDPAFVRRWEHNWKSDFRIYVCNIGIGPATSGYKLKLYIREPGSTVYQLADSFTDCWLFRRNRTEYWILGHAFQRKGEHDIKAVVEARKPLIGEVNMSNNTMEKTVYVIGLPPERPDEPSIVPKELYRGDTCVLSTRTTDPDGDPLRYIFRIKGPHHFIPGWTPENRGWLETNSVEFTPTCENKMWESGFYWVEARAGDISDGQFSEWSDPSYFEVRENRAPVAVEVSGHSSGMAKSKLDFTISGSDPDGDRFEFWVHWGDASSNTYYTEEGENSIDVCHTYSKQGTYDISVYATDIYCGAHWGETDLWKNRKTITISPYVPPSGAVAVDANHPEATFSITGPISVSSRVPYSRPDAPVGTYTIEWRDITGYNTPPLDTQELVADGSISFYGEYTHQTGTIEVRTNNPLAYFRIVGSGTADGQEDFEGWGTYWPISDAYVGYYTITYESISGYGLPAQEKKYLSKNETLIFEGNYFQLPVAYLDFNIPNGFAVEGEDVITFDGSRSYSPEESAYGIVIEKYEFDFGDGRRYVETAHDVPDDVFDGKTEHVFTRTVIHTITLTVYDSSGNSGKTSGNVLVKARPGAHIMAIDLSRLIAGEAVGFIKGWGTDADGDAIVSYQWQSSVDGNLVPSDSSFSTDLLSPGEHTISFKVQDSDGLWSEDAQDFLLVYEPKQWAMFKRDKPRLSHPTPYRGRTYGQLDYAPSWMYGTGGAINGSPVAANLDGDWTNGLEIAVTSTDGNLYVVDSSGTLLLWSSNIGSSSSTPAIDNLLTDGPPCVVVGSSNGVYAFDPNGNPLSGFPFVGGGPFDSTPVIANINFDPNDGKEMVIGCNDGYVYAINSDGTLRWSYPPVPPIPPKAFFGSAAVAEIDPNIYGMETVIGGTDGRLYVLDVNGTLITSWPSGAPVWPIRTTPAIAHLVPNASATGGVETNIVFGSLDGNLYCLWYDSVTATLKPSTALGYPFTAGAPIRSSPAIGILGAEGIYDAQVAFGCDNGTLYVLDGKTGWGLASYTCPSGKPVRSTPAIANIDTRIKFTGQEGEELDFPEVIFGGIDGFLYAVNFGGWVPKNLPWSPLWLTTGAAILSSPAVADINHDPDMEILIGATDGVLHAITPKKDPGLKPVVDFTADPVSGNPPLTVYFTGWAISDPNLPLTWWWDFGDGSTATTQDPNHTYAKPGSYTVSLAVTNAHGTGTETKEDYITVNPFPIAAFTQFPFGGTVPLTVSFTDKSQYDPNSWLWTFGDNETSSEQNPSHTYTEPGLYTVSLRASNEYGSDEITKTDCVLARAPMPIADFTQDVTSGKAPLTVNFTDLSTGSPTSWLWNFGDASQSTEQNPTHIYNEPGSYLVNLTVSNSRGSDTTASPVLIQVCEVDYGADFNHDCRVNFKDFTIFASSWLAQPGQQHYDGKADFNQDGTVDMKDLYVLASEWLLEGHLIVAAGTTVTQDGPRRSAKFEVAGRLIVEDGADLTFTSQSYIDGVPTGGIRPEIIVNGGSLHIDARLDMGTNKADNGGNDAYLTMNAGYFRVGTEASSADSGDLKFPDDDEPVGPHRIYLNGGVLRVHRCEMFVERDAIIYVGGGTMEIEDLGRGDPQDWKNQGGLLPAEGYAEVVIEYNEPVPGGAKIYALP